MTPNIPSSFQPISQSDLKDPTLFKLNNELQLMYNKISALYGGGSISLGASITLPGLYITGQAQPPTNLQSALTLASGNALYAPSTTRTSLLFGTSTQPLPVSGGGPPSPATAGVVLEAANYCGGSGLSNTCINNAIAALPSTGGAIHCKTGTWNFTGPVNCNLSNVIIYGDGFGTEFLRTANMPSSMGMFDVTASGVSIQTCQINGAVTTPVGLQYLTAPPNGFNVASPETGFNTDYPLASTLTANTSVWVHGGSNNFSLYGVMITQTGGYAVLLDATLTSIQNVLIDGNFFTLNKPNLFGSSSGDLNYGSWTGGVLYCGGTYQAGTGTLSYLTGLIVTNNRWFENNGNCIWGYSPQLTVLHDNIVINGNHLQDCGLDAINIGASQNVTNGPNTAYRIGYINGTPKYLSGYNAVAYDTSGYVRAAKYVGLTAFQVNGFGMSLDGLTDSTVSGNTIVNADPSDYYYTLDDVAAFNAGQQGIQTNNTYDLRGGKNVSITGNTIRNMAYNALVLFNNRNSIVSGNTIVHLPSAGGVPVELANNILSGTVNTSGTTVTWVSGSQFDTNINGIYTSGLWLDNGYLYITINGVQYQISSVASATSLTLTASAGTHSAVAWGLGKLQNNTVTANQIYYNAANICIFENNQYGAVYGPNYIYNNRVIGANLGEVGISTTTPNASRTNVVLSTNAPFSTGSPNPLSQSILQREGTSTSAVTKIYSTETGTWVMQVGDIGPILNVSTGGAANTGALVTASRTTFGSLVDYLYTGKTIVDGYRVWGMYNLNTTFYDTEMNSLTDSYGAIRYRRVGSVGTGGVMELSVSTSGGNRVWSTIASGSSGVAGSDTQVQYNDAGSFGADGNLKWAYTTPTQTLTITGGTVTGVCSTSGTAVTWVSGNTFQAGQAGEPITINSVSYTVSLVNSSTSITLTTSAGTQSSVNFTGGVVYPALVVTDANSPHTAYIRSDGGFYTGSVNYQAIQAPSGGVYAALLTTTGEMAFDQEAAPAVSASGQTTLYMDSTTHLLMGSQNGGAYVPVISAASVAGSDTYVQYNKSGAFGADANFKWSYTTPSQQLKITGGTGASAYAALLVTDSNSPHTAYIESDGGFYSTLTNGNTVNIPNGGVTASTVSATSSAFNGLQNNTGGAAASAFYPAANASHPTNPTGSFGGLGFLSGSTYWYFNGTSSIWGTFNFAAINVPGSDQEVIYNDSGSFMADANFKWAYTTPSQQLKITGGTGASAYAALLVTDSNSPHTAYIESDGGFYTPNTNSNAVNVPNGGMLSRYLALATPTPSGSVYPTISLLAGSSGIYGRVFGSVVSSDYGTLYLSSNLSYNGSAWVADVNTDKTAMIGMDPGSTTPFTVYVGTGTGIGTSALQIYDNGNVGIQGAATSAAGVALTVAGSTGVATIVVTGGYMQSAQGFYSANSGSSAATTVNCPSGGAQFGLGVQVNTAYYMKALSSSPGSPSSGYGGLYYNSGSTYDYWNGSAWAAFNFGTAGAVSSVTGSGSGISISPTTGAVVVSNTGVTSLAAGGGISVNAATGAITVTNSGVTALTAGTGVTLSGSTGSVTVSIGQAVATTSTVTFSTVSVTSSSNSAINCTGGIDCSAIYASIAAYNAISTAGALAVRTTSANLNDLTSEGVAVINQNHVFVGQGVDCPSYGITGSGFNPFVGGTQYTGAAGPYTCNWSLGFTIGGTTYHNLEIAGGVIVGIS